MTSGFQDVAARPPRVPEGSTLPKPLSVACSERDLSPPTLTYRRSLHEGNQHPRSQTPGPGRPGGRPGHGLGRGRRRERAGRDAARVRRAARRHGRAGRADGRRGRRRGGRGHRLLAHQRPRDPRLEQHAGAHRRRQLVRLRDGQLCAAWPVVPGLQGHDEPDEVARIQHDPAALQRRHLQGRHHAEQHQLLPDEHRPAGPDLAAGDGQDRQLRGLHRPAGHPGPAPSGLQRAVGAVVHLDDAGVDLAQRPDGAGDPLRGQHRGRRDRPAQRAARPGVLGLRRHDDRLAPGRPARPATPCWPPTPTC